MIAGDNFQVNQAGSHMQFGNMRNIVTTENDFDQEVMKQLQLTIELVRNGGKGDSQPNLKLSKELRAKLT